jgi:threonine/homoserine/homoserine lactone efflux protein
MLWCNGLALFTAKASERVKLNPTVSKWLSRTTGTLFVWLGVKLALAKQH